MTQAVQQYQGPLQGLNVLDFGHYYAGPIAAMMLADQGANVIRVLRPQKGATPSQAQTREIPEQQFRLLNRNKKLLVLDLKTEAGKSQALELIAQADVLIENFRPGVMKRLGLDYASIKQKNPGIVYLSLPGFASTDKERAHIQAWEGVLCAAAGVYTQTSQYRQYLGFPPVYTWVPQCSVYGAMNAVIAIMAALNARERHGSGTVVEVPLAEGGMFGFVIEFFIEAPFGTWRTAKDKSASGENASATKKASASKKEMPAHLKPMMYSPEDSHEVVAAKLEKARHTLESGPTWRAYKCADDREIFLFTFGVTGVVDRLMNALGITKQVKREGFLNDGPWVTGLDNNITSGPEMSPERRERIDQIFADAFAEKTAAEWEQVLLENQVIGSIIRTREEWLAVEPMLASGVFTRMDNGESALTVPGRLADVAGPGDSLMEGYEEMEPVDVDAANALFKQRRQPPACSNPDSSGPRTLRQGDLVDDLRVLDMANIAAGPIAGMMLARYGAKVIKADPPHYVHPGLVPGMGGKRSILTDAKTAEGRKILEQLISNSDVVLHNIIDDTARRLGVTHAQVQAVNPEAITAQITAYGGSKRGYWELRPGFDNILQSATGLMTQFGSLEEPHWHGGVSCSDVMGAFTLAFAVLAGVYQKRTQGYAGEVRTSLARVVNYAQLPYMIAENGKSDWGEARGQFAVGEHWWQRLYKCKDKWIYVGTRQSDAPKLAEVVTGQAIPASDESAANLLAASFAEFDLDHWLQKLDAAGIACHQVMSVDDLCDAVEVRDVPNEAEHDFARGSYEVLRYVNHPSGFPLLNLGFTQVRVGEDHSYFRLGPPSRLGFHAREILSELGYSPEQIDELIAYKVSHEYLPALRSKEAYFFTPESG